MPQFHPGEVKTAKVTMRNPANKAFDYHAMLYMGVDQVAMAEADFRLNAGESKDISFSVTMPEQEGVYPVYLSAFSAGQLLAHFQAAENVEIAALTLAQAGIEIMQVDGRRLRETGYMTLNYTGYPAWGAPYLELEEMIVKSNLFFDPGLTLVFRNVNLPLYDPDMYTHIQFRYQYVVPGGIGDPYSDAPQFLGMVELPGTRGGIVTVNFNVWYGGWWRAGPYDAAFQWGLKYGDQAWANMNNRFVVRDSIYVTTTGGGGV